jgi:ATP-binding cassette subfamily B protein
MAIISMMFRNLLRSAYQQSRTQLSRLIAFLAENLAGMGLVQAYYQEKEQLNLFINRNRRYFKESTREIRATVLFNRTFDIFGNVTIAAVVWIGGYAVFDQQMEFGVLFAFITYIRQFFVPVNQMTQQWNTLQSTLVSMDRLWRIFSQQPEVKDPSQDIERHLELRNVAGRVDFEKVWFGYDEFTPVIRELNLHVKPGEFVGIVGTTGAGKSSLVNLLTRFYDVKSGRIKIDGVDIRHVPLEELNRIVGLVQQEPFLYSGSIIDNVRMFDSNISRDKVVEACRIIGAESMIQRLQAGYNTRLSDRGSGLSAGERQLISFARILVFEPRILILDEATANLDSHTERMIQQALDTVSRGRTTLVIAHRLSTIQHADRIIVIKEGKIIEEGNHRQLMELDGHYAELQRHAIQALSV